MRLGGIIEKGNLIFCGTQEELRLKAATGGVIEVAVADRNGRPRTCCARIRA